MNDRSLLIEEKRVRYRTGTDLLSVTVLDMEGRKTPGRILDVSAGGVGLFVRQHEDPGYEGGKVVWLCITSQLLSDRVVAAAQIRRIEECDIGRLYGVEFLERTRLIAKLPPALARVFNRRRRERFRLDADRPVEITIPDIPATSWDQVFGGVKGVLRDISPRGLCLRFDPGTSAEIERKKSLEIQLSVPGCAEALEFTIRILHSGRRFDGLYCGALFDPERTRRFVEKQRKLLKLLAHERLIPVRKRSLELPASGQLEERELAVAS